MKVTAVRLAALSCTVAASVMIGVAQDRKDPRVGLKAGYKDAGQAILNLELVASLGKPEGFYDPKEPLGAPIAPERETPPADANAASAPATPAAPAAPAPYNPEVANKLNYTNSDLAFDGVHLFAGNYHGFNTYDIESGTSPKLIASVVCPGGQGDVSVYGKLLFMSVEQTRGRLDCGTQGTPTAISAERFRGVRVFDISDLRKPKQIAAVQTCRGSHTHTLIVDPKDKDNIYIYGSGTGAVRDAQELAECSGGDPKDNANTALFSIDVIQVPLAAPQNAKVVNRPRIFSDPKTGVIAGLWMGGDHGTGTQRTSVTNQCHDITVFPEIGLAAGACSGNGILMDISDPVHPTRLDQVLDSNFAYWHSATFNNDGTKVVFTDEWGGGSRPRCRATDLPNWGADAIFDIVDKKLVFKGYYKMPAAQSDQENCVAHNGSLIPVPGRDVMVQAWYQGGLSVFDFTDSAHPFEIAYFDRGPLDAEKLMLGGYWSTYWYNGRIYGAEIARGLDVFTLKPSQFLSQNEIAAAVLVHSANFNAQKQTKIEWPADSVVARAYLDQLGRSNGLPAARIAEVRTALDAADRARSGSQRAAAAAQIDTLSTQLEADAAKAPERDAMRIRAIEANLKARRLR